MRNPIRLPNVTCAVCTVPIEDRYTLCYRCSQDSKGPVPVARRVVPLTYAFSGHQSNTDMHHYKDPMPEWFRPQNPSFQRVQLLLLGFTVTHAGCLDRVGSRPVTRLTSVPSLGGRTGLHPLGGLREVLPKRWRRFDLLPRTGIPAEERRLVRPDHFVLADPSEVAGYHVVVLEDTWVQGGHAQSAAATILQAGAAEVTILVIARRIGDQAGRSLIERLLSASLRRAVEYNVDICPVTGGACPPASR
ncbi:hypothetical protein [Herbidospora sp. RD11066]